MHNYLLIQVTPSGAIRHLDDLVHAQAAGRCAGIVLHHAGKYPETTAMKFGTLLAERVGELVEHEPTGYRFRILKADRTVDGELIVPGLKVVDYDREKGVVDPAQFASTDSLGPGGEFFNGWYDVRRDSDGYVRAFNGERMTTVGA